MRARVRLIMSLPVTALWLLFAVANFATWRKTHVPLGLGAIALELVIAALFVVRRGKIVRWQQVPVPDDAPTA